MKFEMLKDEYTKMFKQYDVLTKENHILKLQKKNIR